MLIITKRGQLLRCRRSRSDQPGACRECGAPIPAGVKHIRQGITDGGRAQPRRYCAACAVARGVATESE